MQPEYQILLFYKYIYLKEPVAVRDWLFSLCQKYSLTGRSIVATEGINITVEGKTSDTEAFITALETDERFRDIHFKKSAGTGMAFPRLSVKVRPEIVTGNLGICDIDPNIVTGKRLSPEMLHQWFQEGKEFYIVDMRNFYEHNIGKFKGSICPPMDNFRDLSNIVKTIEHLKHKTVLTVCTGGVRCEKASGYLITKGFSDVWQLDGGIVSYMEKYPNEHFEGKLYVFDGRVVMGFYTDDPHHKVIGRCEACGSASERFVNCSHDWCGKHFILCEECSKKQLQRQGKVTCVDTCRLRRPTKIHSPLQRVFVRIKTLFR